MIKKLVILIQKYKDILLYLIFGVLTTLVNYAIYLPLCDLLNTSLPRIAATVSNGVAWIGSVLFAYLTNKPFVFKSHDWSSKTVFPELTKFVGCRLGSGLIETAIILLTVDILRWENFIMKVITSVLVVIMNYIASKWLVFTNKSE